MVEFYSIKIRVAEIITKCTHARAPLSPFPLSQITKMSKLERLNARVEKLLAKAVQEVLEVVKETVSEYQEKTARTQRENQSLKRRLQELQEKINSHSNGRIMSTFEYVRKCWS